MVLQRKAACEKGQDIIEYALMLAIIVGIGLLIYSQAGLRNSISSVFSNAGNLMEIAASSEESKENQIFDIVGKAIGNHSLHLDPNTFIFSGTDAGSQLAQELNISSDDVWSIGHQVSSDGSDYYVLMYYSAEQRGPISNYASQDPSWNWTVQTNGRYSYPRQGAQVQVPVSYAVYDTSTGAQNTSMRETYFTGSSGSEGMATLAHPSGSTGYTLR